MRIMGMGIMEIVEIRCANVLIMKAIVENMGIIQHMELICVWLLISQALYMMRKPKHAVSVQLNTETVAITILMDFVSTETMITMRHITTRLKLIKRSRSYISRHNSTIIMQLLTFGV